MSKEPSLGVSEEMIATAESELGLRFPEELRNAWKQYNCNELRGGWRVFPVFDPANPRKTCGSVTYENLKGAWGQEVMAQDLVSIADNGTGNQLVLKVTSGLAEAQVYHWSHETRKLTPWKPGIASIHAAAGRSRANVLRLQKRFANAPSTGGN
ncbi:putative glucan synthasis protein [Acidovorax sp. CF316]|uniref:SMI1/KNR4 family protein n=1 Tax=Acidovorax sp. CF316 TaxID=1144317 RepID=UPI00026BCE89|nr:SMI1/KNR4 family protein [Acidovorax sp. CF316]EJE54515.1 putative glucan synthasis protein [Acidovorax sp. CF316]